MPLINWDDIQAEENRRREVAVKAGASPRATKYEDSPLKQMVADAVEEAAPTVADAFAEYRKNHPLPWYNFVATPIVKDTAEEVITRMRDAAIDAARGAAEEKDLQREARENEMKITRTSTGEPKVEHGEEVEPLQGFAHVDNSLPDKEKPARPDIDPPTNPGEPTHPIVEPGKPGKPDNELPGVGDKPDNKPGDKPKPDNTLPTPEPKNPSPIGSGDARASQASKDNK